MATRRSSALDRHRTQRARHGRPQAVLDSLISRYALNDPAGGYYGASNSPRAQKAQRNLKAINP